MKGEVFYQIYLPSFSDGSGDGWGDLKGILDRLDYLNDGTDQSLQIKGIILSPLTLSRGRDWFYAPFDHFALDERFGHWSDLARLRRELTRRGMWLYTDLILNHTSDRHPWFVAARRSRHNPFRDWYYFRDGQGDRPPNNWLSPFGGSQWSLDRRSGQYYLHTFHPDQPDLNWRHRPVRQELARIIRFWRQKGIDGFRLDAFPHLFKDEGLRDDPPNAAYNVHDDLISEQQRPINSAGHDQLASHLTAFLREFRNALAGADLIVETYLTKEQRNRFYRRYTGRGGVMDISLADLTLDWQLPLQPAFYELGNHDRVRIVSRLGTKRTRLLALLQLTLPGTALIYQGEELGLPDCLPSAGRSRDEVERHKRAGRRDGARLPLPWEAATFQQFSGRRSWLPLPRSYRVYLVDQQTHRDDSWLAFYRRLIAIRKQLRLGRRPLKRELQQKSLFVFSDDQVKIVVNWSNEPRRYRLKAPARLLFSTTRRYPDTVSGQVSIHPYEGFILAL